MRRKQKSPAARRTKRAKALNNKPTEKRRATFRSCISCACVETKTTENSEPPLGAASLSCAWKPKRLNTKTKASDYGCISCACVETKTTENGEPLLGAASLSRVETKTTEKQPQDTATRALFLECFLSLRLF